MSGAPAHIVVADDAPDILHLVRITLERAGHDVTVCEDGRGVLAAVEERVPDLVVLDVFMPDLDGLETTRRLRADPRTQDVPVVVLTAAVHGTTLADARAAGADAALRKPFRPAHLAEQVAGLLSSRPGRGAA